MLAKRPVKNVDLIRNAHSVHSNSGAKPSLTGFTTPTRREERLKRICFILDAKQYFILGTYTGREIQTPQRNPSRGTRGRIAGDRRRWPSLTEAVLWWREELVRRLWAQRQSPRECDSMSIINPSRDPALTGQPRLDPENFPPGA